MEIFVNSITGIDDAICTMYLSKHNLDREKEIYIRNTCKDVLDRYGHIYANANEEKLEEYNNWIKKLCNFGKRHITMLRFIDISCSVYGLHRAGQDDVDAHTCRFNNRIIRNSSRFVGIKNEENLQNMSEYYKDKVLTTDAALAILGITTPEEIEYNGKIYLRAFNGYIEKGMENNQDVKRGLYNLGFPSNFLFKVNLTEWSHVFKERNENGGANPEVKKWCEMIADEIQMIQPSFNRELFLEIKN